MTHILFLDPSKSSKRRRASCPAKARAFRKRALSSGIDDLRTGSVKSRRMGPS